MLESPSPSDHDLLRRIASRDENAFLTFYRRHQSLVYRFALQMSGSAEQAEEVTQDVFMTVMGSAKQYDPERGSAAAYLIGIARNLVLRSIERDWPYVMLDDADGGPAVEQDPLDELTRQERIESLKKAVLTLPPAYREVVVLCDLHELDYTEAAEVLGCAIGTIRSRLHRARALLLEKMRASERCAV